MKWNNIKTTILKEIRGVCRDKKTLQKLILYPLLIPMVILLFGFLFDGMTEADYVIGTNYKITEEEKLIIDELDGISLINYDNKSKLEPAYEDSHEEYEDPSTYSEADIPPEDNDGDAAF